MADIADVIRDYFLKLGFTAEIADIYIVLYSRGEQSISQLSREAGVERTYLYRIMADLESSGLIEIETRRERKVIRAAPISNVQVMLSKKEQQLQELYEEYGDLQEALTNTTQSADVTKVQTYRGIDGLKQMFWNETRSKTENLTILQENMQIHTKLSFFERWVRVCNERGIHSRSIVGDSFLRSQQEWYARHANERMNRWKGRYISEKAFPITQSMTIYNDVTAYYNWQAGEVIGIEIYNAHIANMQRQFFEMLWAQATDIKE
jgi:sugar-specific transcriptional regulator TrmB